MSTAVTILYPPPLRGSKLSTPEQHYMLSLQNLHPMYEVDTTAGSFAAVPPEAGQDAPSGRNNQNAEITYIKISADGNTFTLNGVAGGALTLTANGQFLKIKSNGTLWRRSG